MTGVDLTNAVIDGTRIREIDLEGVKYSRKQIDGFRFVKK